uniref:Uncharacterized protein n=1 Tax=Macrostomum lignano TaxID=282301 RepID=A0A1I8FQ23_9PLAT
MPATQYLVAVATNQHVGTSSSEWQRDANLNCSNSNCNKSWRVHKALVEASTRLLREPARSRSAAASALKRNASPKCQLAKEGGRPLIRRPKDGGQTAASGRRREERQRRAVTAAFTKRWRDFAIGSDVHSLSRLEVPRSVAADKYGGRRRQEDEQCFVCQRQCRNSSLLSLGSCRLDGSEIAANIGRQQPPTNHSSSSDFSSRLCKRIQQQQQLGSVKNRVTQVQHGLRLSGHCMQLANQPTAAAPASAQLRLPPFAVAVREFLWRRRPADKAAPPIQAVLAILSKELEKFELQLPATAGAPAGQGLFHYFFTKKPPISAKAFASQSKRLLQQQQQKTSDSMMSATAYISPAVSTDFSHEMLAWYDSHRQRVLSTASSSDCYCCSCCCCDSSAAAASSAGADRTELDSFL